MELLIANIDEISLSSFDFNKLNDYQKNKINNKESLAGLYLLDKLLEKRNLNLADIFYENGKPSISGYYLSVTHKNNFIAVVISQNRIGIDLELIRNFNQKIPLSFFSPEEKNFLEQKNNQKLAFYQVYTTKEAISKITSLGLKSFPDFNIVKENQIKYQNYQIKHIYFNNQILTIVEEGL